MTASEASIARRPRLFAYAAAKLRALASRDRTLALIVALVSAAVAFEPRVKVGGFTADDWALYAADKFPQIGGFHTPLGALQPAAGSRIGHMFYWWISFSLFGSHTRLYSAAAAALCVVMAFSFYLLLRELRFSVVHSLGMMLLLIVAPSVEVVRLWFTPAGVQIALSLFFVGLLLALRAFDATGRQQRRLHIASWCLYLASAVYVETALPLIVVSVLVYMTRTKFATSLRRWVFDMIVVIGGYIAALEFVSTQPGFKKLPSAMWGEHAEMMVNQVLTIFTRMLRPLSVGDTQLYLVGVGALAAASFTLWRRGMVSHSVRIQLQRWGTAFIICLAAVIASYAVYVPAMLYYEPLGPGLAAHINSVIAAPLAVALFATVMLARIVLREIFTGLVPRASYLATAVVAVWFTMMVVDGALGVRHDAHIWAVASGKGAHVLRVLRTDLPNPPHEATIYTFGEAGTDAPGMPIFFTSWEQTNAVKTAYDRPDLSSYPMVESGMHPICTARGVEALFETQPMNEPSRYGLSYFFDLPTGRYTLIESMAGCTRALRSFHLGPYVSSPSFEWWH